MFVKQIENGLDLSGVAESVSAVFDTSLEPDQSIQSHYHTDLEEIYYVLSGYGLMTVGEEQNEVARGDVIHIPPLALHKILNTGNVPLRFVTVAASSRDNRYEAQPYIS